MRRSILGRATRAAALAMTACVALTLTACSGSSPISGGGKGDLTAEDSPLNKWFESISNDEEFDEDAWKEQAQAAEEATAACMQEQGFEYTPVDYSDQVFSFSDEDGPQWGTKEFAEKYGYATFNMMGAEESDDPEAPGNDEYSDPNQEYIESMSESEQNAYYTALSGDMNAYDWDDPDFDPSSIPVEEQGCNGKAWAEINSTMGGDLWQSEEMTALNEELNTFYDSLNEDAAMKDVDAKWADCMADAGYSEKGWAKPSDPEEWFMEESNRMWEEANPQEPTEDESAAPDLEANGGDDNWVDPSTTKEYKQMAETEIKTAVADYTCREKTGWDQARLKIQFKAEQEFMDAHKELMDKIVELAAESGK